MANTVRVKRRAAGGAAGAPATLANAELAFNEQDKTLYYGEGTGGAGGSATVVIPIAGPGAFVDRTTAQAIAGVKAFSDSPTVPTAAPGTSNTQVASTAFVAAAVTGGSVADGDKGDITVAAGGSAWTIDSGAVTNTKLAAAPASTLKGNATGAAAAPTDLTVAAARTLLAVSNVDNTSDANKPVSTAQQTALNLKLNASEKGAANGVATLDGAGKIPTAQIPAVALNDTFVVATQAAMLALIAQVGDMAIRTDINKSFILRVDGAATLANWQEILTPTDAVQSVFGRSGTVSAQAGDYAVAQVTGAAPLASPALSGTPTAPTAATATNTTQLATTAFVQANNALTLLKTANLSDVANVATARTNLGLGTMAVQNAAAVAITGGTIDNITLDGGTF